MADPGAKRGGLRWLGVAVSLVSVAAVVLWALGQDAPTLPSTPGELAWLAAAVGLYFLACAARAERWLLLLRENGAKAQRRDCYALTAVGFMGNNVLPARAGDAMRVLLAAPRAGLDRRSVLGTLVAERILDVVVLFTLFAVVAFGLLNATELPDTSRLVLAAAVLAVLAVAVVAAGVVLWRKGKLARVVGFLKPIGASTAKLRGRHGAEALAWTLALWFGEVVTWFATGEAAGLGISLLETCYLISLSSIFVLVPAGPGYAGTLDAAVIFGSRALDKSAQTTLSYLLLLRFVLLVPITLAGLVALVTRYGGLRALRLATWLGGTPGARPERPGRGAGAAPRTGRAAGGAGGTRGRRWRSRRS